MIASLSIAAFVMLLGFALVRGVFLGYPKRSLVDGPLSAKEQAIVAAAADAFFPRGGALSPSGTDAGAVAYFSTMLAEVPAGTQILIRMLLRLVEHGPWVFAFSRRFTRQSPAERVATLAAWEKSSIYFLRISFQSLRTLIGLAYLGNDEVAGALGALPNLAPFEGARS